MQRVTARGLLGWPLSVCPRAHTQPTPNPVLKSPASKKSKKRSGLYPNSSADNGTRSGETPYWGDTAAASESRPEDVPPETDIDAELLWESTQQYLHRPCPVCNKAINADAGNSDDGNTPFSRNAQKDSQTVCSHACMLEIMTTRTGYRRKSLYDRWDYLSVCVCDGPCVCGCASNDNSALNATMNRQNGVMRMSAIARQIAQAYQSNGMIAGGDGGLLNTTRTSASDVPHTHAHMHTYWQRFGQRFLRRRAWSSVYVGTRVPLAGKNVQVCLPFTLHLSFSLEVERLYVSFYQNFHHVHISLFFSTYVFNSTVPFRRRAVSLSRRTPSPRHRPPTHSGAARARRSMAGAGRRSQGHRCTAIQLCVAGCEWCSARTERAPSKFNITCPQVLNILVMSYLLADPQSYSPIIFAHISFSHLLYSPPSHTSVAHPPCLAQTHTSLAPRAQSSPPARAPRPCSVYTRYRASRESWPMSSPPPHQL